MNILSPTRIRSVPTKESLHVCASAAGRWLEVGNRLASADDSEVFATMLNRIEKIRKVPSGIRRSDLSHEIRLSDPTPMCASRALLTASTSSIAAASQRTAPSMKFVASPTWQRRT
jgi:hypothetical protein